MGSFTWEALVALVSGLATIVLAIAAVRISMRQTDLARRQTQYVATQTELAATQTELSGKMTALEESRDDPRLVPTRLWRATREERKVHGLSSTYFVEIRNGRVGPAINVVVDAIVIRAELRRDARGDLPTEFVSLRLENLNAFFPMVWDQPVYFGFDLPDGIGEIVTPRSVARVEGKFSTCRSEQLVDWVYPSMESQVFVTLPAQVQVKSVQGALGEGVHDYFVLGVTLDDGSERTLMPDSVRSSIARIAERREDDRESFREFLNEPGIREVLDPEIREALDLD